MLRISNLHESVADKPILSGLSLSARGAKQLPMKFAVDAQKLLGISLEGSVG